MTIGHILTANRLKDGLVVFLTPAGIWSVDVNEAVLTTEPFATRALEKRGTDFEASNAITDAYLVEATRDHGIITPVHIRERIRAIGPTINYGAVGGRADTIAA